MECITNRGELTMRTKLMAFEAATRFARCLSANVRFAAVAIETSSRAKGEKRHFVTFLPASRERLEALAQRQQDARTERAFVQEFTFCADRDTERLFWWCYSHESGETYETTEQSCSCPDAEYRCRANGLRCKHQIALSQAIRAEATVEFKVIPDPARKAFDAKRFEEIFG